MPLPCQKFPRLQGNCLDFLTKLLAYEPPASAPRFGNDVKRATFLDCWLHAALARIRALGRSILQSFGSPWIALPDRGNQPLARVLEYLCPHGRCWTGQELSWKRDPLS